MTDSECVSVKSSSMTCWRSPELGDKSTERRQTDVEVQHDEVPLVGEADAPSGHVAVVVPLQNALVADDAVMTARRSAMLAAFAPLPSESGVDVSRTRAAAIVVVVVVVVVVTVVPVVMATVTNSMCRTVNTALCHATAILSCLVLLWLYSLGITEDITCTEMSKYIGPISITLKFDPRVNNRHRTTDRAAFKYTILSWVGPCSEIR